MGEVPRGLKGVPIEVVVVRDALELQPTHLLAP